MQGFMDRRMPRTRLWLLGGCCAGLFEAGMAIAAQPRTPPAPTPRVETLQLREHVYMVTGAGNNIVFQTGNDGVLVIGAGNGRATDAVLAEIRKVTDRPIRYLINTGAAAEEIGGNQAIAAAGERFGAAQTGGIFNEGAIIIAHEDVATRMSDGPSEAWPSETFFPVLKTMYMNGEGIEIRHRPASASDGVVTVFLRKSDVIIAGELIDTERFPKIDVAHGGSVDGLLTALNSLVWEAISTIPLPWRDGGTLVVPARGRVYERDDVVQYRDMVTVVRDRVRDLIANGLTKQQVIAANPAKGYVNWFGADRTWTANQFVEAVYESLVKQP